MQATLLRTGCRAGPGALRRIVSQAGSRGLPPTAPKPVAPLGQAALGASLRSSGASASGMAAAAATSGGGVNGFAGMVRRLREHRLTFRTFSSGGGGSGGSGGGGGGGGGGSGGGSSGGFGGLWAAYLALLEQRPVATKSLTAALLNGLGDAIAQTQFETGPFDWKRCGIFTLLGLVLIGPALHVWYGSLGHLVKASGTTGTVAKLALDQLCFAPFFISTIVSCLMALEGKGPEIVPTLKRNLPDMVKSNWMLWVPFQFFNFRFVPGHLQVLASNMCALLWNTYMSYKAHH